MRDLRRKLLSLGNHFFERLKTANFSTACGTSTLKSLPSRAFFVSDVHLRPRKHFSRCTLDCGFKTSESPALRGFEAERCPIRGTSLYLVIFSNGLRHSKNLPVKFGFSSKSVPANIAKKLPLQRCSKPLFIPIFNFSHKRPMFAFTSESGYTPGFRRKIAHSGSHAETGAFPSAGTAWLCAANRIALNAAFATPDSTVLLYTYISRFSVNPHYQQTRKIRQSCRLKLYLKPFLIPIFNFSHKRPTFAFTGESGHTLGFPRRIAHKGSHAETGVFRTGVVSLPSDCFTRFGNPAWPGGRTAYFAAFGSWLDVLPKNAESLGTAMRLCASLFRGVAAPLGCAPCCQYAFSLF